MRGSILLFYLLFLSVLFLVGVVSAQGACNSDSDCGTDKVCVGAQCIPLVFEDDFSTDPNNRPDDWKIVRSISATTSNTGVKNSNNEFELTTNRDINNRHIYTYPNVDITSKKWRVEYDYYVGVIHDECGGMGGLSFYVPNSGQPFSGSTSQRDTATVAIDTNRGVARCEDRKGGIANCKNFGGNQGNDFECVNDFKWYCVEPHDGNTGDHQWNRKSGIELTYPNLYKHLDFSNEFVCNGPGVNRGWGKVSITYDNGHTIVKYKGSDKVDYTIQDMDYSNDYLSLWAFTGADSSYMKIDNLKIYSSPACGNGICDANECKTAVSGKTECAQDCQYQCSDGCDNDDDGTRDALVEYDILPPTFDFNDFDQGSDPVSDGIHYKIDRFLNIIGDTTHPELRKDDNSQQSTSPKIITMKCEPKWNGKCVIPNRQDKYSGHAYCNQVTADKICDLKGYRTSTFVCRDAYASPDDNTLVYWDLTDNNFKVVRADDSRFLSPVDKEFSSLVCSNPIVGNSFNITCKPTSSDHPPGWFYGNTDNPQAGYVPGSPAVSAAQCLINCKEWITANGEPNTKYTCQRHEKASHCYDPVKEKDIFSRDYFGCNECQVQDCTTGNLTTECNDGIDNDGDGKIDSEDDGCASIKDDSEYPHDLSCSDPDDDDEGTSQCSDGINNDDNDDLIDYCDSPDDIDCDPDCDSPDDSEVPECSDGEDNDDDGKTDYCDDGTCDPNCQSLDDDNEACESKQIIMKLETEGDSLGALWNDANYNVNICYEEIFGEEYVGDNPHVCDVDNKVLGLEHSTKAYAETPESTIYDYDHCDGADIDRNKIVEKADLDEYIEKLKSDCRNIADVDINLIFDALNNNSFDKTCTANNNFCELLDINGDDELVPGDMSILVNLKNGCTGTGNPNIVSNADLNEDGYVNYLDREILLIALADKPIGTVDCDEVDISNNVCYGDLRCRSIDTGDSNAGSCDETGEEIVASLSVATDAKISKGDDADFPIKICCKLEVIQLESAYWAYMDDEIIESEDSEGNDVIIGLKDRVKLVAVGKEFKDETITYTIRKKCDGLIDCIGDLFTGNEVVAQTTVKGEFVWDAGKKLDDDTFSEGEYYFTAEIGELEVDSRENLDGSDNPNGILTVGPEDNDPPVALIKFPLDKQMYFIDSPITFEQESFDLDDEFSYSWDLGDGTIKEGNSENLENYKFDYTYETEANLRQQDIVLTVTDARELSDTARVSILIINSTEKAYILAYTDLPKYGEEYGQVVDYDAKSTYAVSSETVFDSDGKCSKVINCLAGNCPPETKGIPTSESLGCDYNGGTEGVLVIPTSGGVNYDNIEFCWVLDDNIAEKICGFGIGGAVFNHKYPSSGLHESSLEASIEYPIIS